MLDSRYSAAPARRSIRKRIFAGASTMMLVAAVWAGTRGIDPGQSIAKATPPPAAAILAIPQPVVANREYTQPAPRLAKLAPVLWRDRAYPYPAASGTARVDWQTHTVARGDTLGRIFSGFSLNIGLASAIVGHDTASALKTLMPGRTMRLGFGRDDQLVALRYEVTRMQELVLRFADGELRSASRQEIPTRRREQIVSGTIGSSLFVSASQAGLSDRLIMQLVGIFGWDVDFALDIHTGDRFSVLYEELLRDGRSIGTGDIIAAEFVTNGGVHRAVRHIDVDGNREYYDLEGNSLRGTFLRTPMRVSRVTSGFSKRRYHPVLKKWRAHRGVDYGAATGTPVLATGDGRVEYAGRKGGYGNAVVLKHGGQYSTLYAHLSRFRKGLKKGERVEQGEVIAYVGATGMVTGPHLHYEFRVNGEHRNPLTYEMPRAESIDADKRETFLAMARERMDQLADTLPKQVARR